MAIKCKECDIKVETEDELRLHMRKMHPLQRLILKELMSDPSSYPTFY